MGIIVRHCDAKGVKLCNRGQRRFGDLHGFDFLDFLHNGIDSDLLPKGDAQVDEVIAAAKARIAREGGSDVV